MFDVMIEVRDLYHVIIGSGIELLYNTQLKAISDNYRKVENVTQLGF